MSETTSQAASQTAARRREITRRSVLIAGPTLGVATAALASCGGEDAVTSSGSIHAPERGSVHPQRTPEEYQFFSPEEASRVDAVVGRILPGDDDDPGAVQGGVTWYVDQKLAEFPNFADPVFLQEPHAQGYVGEQPQGEAAIYVDQDELYRYGYQSGHTPQQIYREGLDGLERYAQTRFGSAFTELSTDRQDDILRALDDVFQRSDDNGETEVDDLELDRAEEMFDPIDPGEFFETLRVDTIEGMFSDPAYGGNRGLVGWSLIGYPGAQRSYSPQEMMHGTNKQPVSMEGLTPMNPDRGDGRDALEQDHHHHVDRG